jgi:DNA repair exonuclease SbcCD ATPase subunit
MTATIAPADLDDVVRRADDRWARRHGDEPAAPEYLQQIIAAVRPLLGQPPAGPVDDVQVQQLLDDKQRLGDLVAELRKQAETRGQVVERQARQVAALRKDLDAADAEARRRVDAAAEVLRTQLDETRAKLAAAGADVERLTAHTAELDRQVQASTAIIERRDADVAQLHATVDEQRAQLAAAERAKPPHHHRYAVDAPGTEPRPCQCGQPYPRAAIVTEDVEPSAPEPWAELLGRIRAEAKKAGWKS